MGIFIALVLNIFLNMTIMPAYSLVIVRQFMVSYKQKSHRIRVSSFFN